MEKCLTKKYGYAWDKYDSEDLKKVFALGERYKAFMSECKTERECVEEMIAQAKANGYRDLDEIISGNVRLKPGDKIYANNRDKALALFIIGTESMEKGMNILGAHVDSPRLDLKQNPLYEDTDLAFLKTHYYGGIKKYQWVTTPMAIHGVVVKNDGEKVKVVIGEDDSDPVFGVSDLLIHLSAEQMGKKASEVIEGENLNIFAGSIPAKPEEKDAKEKVKLNVLNILSEKYGICEEDFVSSEIEIVPAGKARDYGLDKSMIMAYGHDDRVCAYTSFEAMMKIDRLRKNLRHPACGQGRGRKHGSYRYAVQVLREHCSRDTRTLRRLLRHKHQKDPFKFEDAFVRRYGGLRSSLRFSHGEDELCLLRKGHSYKQIHRLQG